jgi:hypothetical protein
MTFSGHEIACHLLGRNALGEASFVGKRGLFTWLVFLFDKRATELENKLGYAPGTLAAGWSCCRLIACQIAQSNIDLRGTMARRKNAERKGDKFDNCFPLGCARGPKKLAPFLDRGLDRRPAKVLPKLDPIADPPARPIGIPQFKFRNPVNLVVLADVKAGNVLRRGDVKF